MDSKTAQIILDITNQLDKSTKTEWYSGDLSDWSEYARNMKRTITTIIPILETIAKPNVESDFEKQLKELENKFDTLIESLKINE